LTRLLLSGKPVQVVVLLDERDGAASGVRLEPALLGVGHREAYVQQGSAAHPVALASGFARALVSGRPALHVIDAPGETFDESEPGAIAAARLAGRAAPTFRFEPAAGASWARRLSFAGNPEPTADWPLVALPEAASAAGAPAAAPFTFADAALLDPARRGEFAAVGEIDSEELVALADWLDLDPATALRRLPYVWAAAADGVLVRLVVRRRLALETADRRAFWRTLQELAGVRSERIDEAVAAALAAAEQSWLGERAELERAHGAELERVRAEAATGVVERLVSGLLAPSLGGGAV
jgi:pyruvate-ferredoxin/flavodoxin oxidoreductase